jgi:transcriptional regulator with XRE-family HTH domain
MVQLNETTIGQRLLNARTERGLTKNLARNILGYTFDTYVATEAGERLPMPVELPAIAYWLAGSSTAGFDGILAELRAQLDTERTERRQPPPDASTVDPGANGAQVVHAAESNTAANP